MEKKAEAYIRKYHMLEPGDCVIAGVSGGADSVCLLHILVSIRQRFKLELQAVHVHHGLRGAEADRDVQFVRDISEEWGVPCLVVYRDVAGYGSERGLSLEEAGRELRYQALYGAAKEMGGAKIAVAHHQDDQAETILHNLFRGSGLKGLGGMAPVRDNVIRPLLCAGRREIETYLEERGISWCKDSTNDSTEYTRNKLRHNVLPLVCREVNVQAVMHIVAAGERVSQAQEYFEKEAARLWGDWGQRERADEGRYRRLGLPADRLEGLPDILQEYVVMEMIGEMIGSRKDISAVHVEQILDLSGKKTGRSFALPYGLKAYREYGMVWLECGEREKNLQPQMLSDHPLFFTECFPASVLREKYGEIPEKKYTKWFDYDRIKDTLLIRTRQTGDYLTLKDGKKKTVKAFMIDEKIPRFRRDEMLLLAEGSHILWIIGCRISEFYKITDETERVLQVRMDGGEEHGR